MNTIDRFIDVPPPCVSYAYAFLMRYEGVLSLRAPEPQTRPGVVTLHLMISPSFLKEADQLLQSLRNEFWYSENLYATSGAD